MHAILRGYFPGPVVLQSTNPHQLPLGKTIRYRHALYHAAFSRGFQYILFMHYYKSNGWSHTPDFSCFCDRKK